jgi:hypothetical protein
VQSGGANVCTCSTKRRFGCGQLDCRYRGTLYIVQSLGRFLRCWRDSGVGVVLSELHRRHTAMVPHSGIQPPQVHDTHSSHTFLPHLWARGGALLSMDRHRHYRAGAPPQKQYPQQLGTPRLHGGGQLGILLISPEGLAIASADLASGCRKAFLEDVISAGEWSGTR